MFKILNKFKKEKKKKDDNIQKEWGVLKSQNQSKLFKIMIMIFSLPLKAKCKNLVRYNFIIKIMTFKKVKQNT